MITRYSNLDTRKTVTRDSVLATRATRQGFTLVELVVSMNAAFIVMVTGALLVSSGYRSWNRSFNTANCEARLGSLDSMIALGAVGRKSNKMDYCIYRYSSGHYTRITTSNPDDILIGQAIEFRYWVDPLKAEYMNPSMTATAYAFFYLDHPDVPTGGELKVDYGPFPIGGPGGVNAAGARSGTAVNTITLAQNVTSVSFSHTARNTTGDGNGCIRMKLIIRDPTDGASKTTLAATLMRNTWPQ